MAAIADKFRYLKVGVSVLLVFIGVKMLIHDFFEIDAVSSLVFIRFFAFRASFTSAPKVSKPGQSFTFAIKHHPHTFYIS